MTTIVNSNLDARHGKRVANHLATLKGGVGGVVNGHAGLARIQIARSLRIVYLVTSVLDKNKHRRAIEPCPEGLKGMKAEDG